MPKTNSTQLTNITGLMKIRTEENDGAGLKVRDLPEATDGGGGESTSGDVLEGVVAILDSLDEWQKSGAGEAF